MSRCYNFCAGPAALPEEVLKRAQEDMLDWQGTGMSVMEMSHRSKEIVRIAEFAEQDLRDLLTELGCEDVRTCIQSGNVVFRSAANAETLSRDIRSAIEAGFGFAPQVMVLTANRFESVVAGNPYADEISDPRSVHVSFLSEEAAAADIPKMKEACKNNESFRLEKHALYFHAPDGIARSTLSM